MNKSTEIEIEILGRTIRLGCQKEEKEDLLSAVALLKNQIQEVRHNGKTTGSDKIVIMAALNIAHKLVTFQTRGIDLHEIRSKIDQLGDEIDTVLNDQDNLF
ncbi:MAG: cell division protein ZapA [Burkholderiales bacterium]|nr:cell division protein ZapA [Burkholderiales bacterium]